MFDWGSLGAARRRRSRRGADSSCGPTARTFTQQEAGDGDLDPLRSKIGPEMRRLLGIFLLLLLLGIGASMLGGVQVPMGWYHHSKRQRPLPPKRAKLPSSLRCAKRT